MKNISAISIMLVAILLALTSVMPAHAAEMVSIADISEETKDGWHQTYEAHGRSIVVDADIVIPEVQAVPILSAGHYTNIQPPVGISDFDNSIVSAVGIHINARKDEHGVNVGSDVNFGWRLLGYTDAENSPFTLDEAQEYARKLFEPLERINLT